jgi:general secretion pathway protein F
MPVFEGKVSVGGKTERVVLTAKSRKDAERILRRKGRVVQLKRQGLFDLDQGLTPHERYTLLLKLSTMLASKVPLGKALTLLADTFGGKIRKVSRSLADKVNNGMQFAAALESEGKSFPSSTVALIKAGLAAGNTSSALREAAEFEHMIQGIKKGSVKEIWTGVGYFSAAAGLMIGTMEYFGPMVTANPMFTKAGVDNQWIEDVGYIVMYINIAILVMIGFLGFMGTAGRLAAPASMDRVIARVPFYSDLVLAKNNYVTFYKLGLLVQSGVRIEESLMLTAADSPRGALRSDIERALELIRKGLPWADGMKTLDPTDKASLLASTDREDIARTFRLLADQFRELYMARVRTLAPMLNLLAALFMSIASAILFGLTILPMLQLATKIS